MVNELPTPTTGPLPTLLMPCKATVDVEEEECSRANVTFLEHDNRNNRVINILVVVVRLTATRTLAVDVVLVLVLALHLVLVLILFLLAIAKLQHVVGIKC